jgi:hypothetical protein
MIQLVLNLCFDRLTKMILPNSSQRFGIREPVGDLEQRGQVVEVDGCCDDRARARFVDGQRPAYQRFGARTMVAGQPSGKEFVVGIWILNRLAPLFAFKGVTYTVLFSF